VTVFIAAIHLLLLAANAAQPPQLPGRLFAGLMALFLGAMAFWAVTMIRHFRKRT